MSDNHNNSGGDFAPGMGDWVQHKANTNVFGVVIGFEGSLIAVRLSPSLAVAEFHEFELEELEDVADDPEPEEAPEGGDNIINFTEARALRAGTKTRGAA